MNEHTQQEIEQHFASIIKLLGFDLSEPNLQDTPKRIAKFYKEFFFHEDDNMETSFPSVQVDQMVIVKDVPFYSLCSHHLLVFSGKVSVGYLASDKILGLSKIPRIIRSCASTLQSQEQLAEDIANKLTSIIDNNGVAVYIEGEHTCMQMRGVRSDGTMITSVLRGGFMEDKDMRKEFLALIK